MLVEELRDAVGEEAADAGSPDVERTLRRRAQRRIGGLGAGALLVGFAGAVAVMVAVIIAPSFESWTSLAVALAVHATLTTLVIALLMRFLTQVEAPDPATAARLEAEGLGDSEAALSDLVKETAGESEERSG